jgi:hypothetical protein
MVHYLVNGRTRYGTRSSWFSQNDAAHLSRTPSVARDDPQPRRALRAEPQDRRQVAAASTLLDEGLPGRNHASLRYRFRNISAVVQELGGPPLFGYSPAQQVGAGVRERIRAMLLANVHFNELVAADRLSAVGKLAAGTTSISRADALAALAKLHRQIDEVDREFTDISGIGHNNPPEPIAPVDERRAAFETARSDIATLETELAKPVVNQQVVARHAEGLLKFGIRMTTWFGQRTTKFVDAFWWHSRQQW